MTTLYIGRFQPFHLGHLSVLEAMHRDGAQHIIIGIGSSQYARMPNNPWTADERRAMIEAVLPELPHLPRISILDIPDIHDDEHWVGHVDRLVAGVGEYDAMYTANDWVAGLMEAAGHAVRPIEMVVPISATAIRRHLKDGSTDWREYVHPAMHSHLERGLPMPEPDPSELQVRRAA